MSIHVTTQVWKRSSAKGASLLVMLALADWADDHGHCFPSITTIQHKTRLSRVGVVKALKDRLAAGELEKLTTLHSASGSRRTNTYRITLVNSVNQSTQSRLGNWVNQTSKLGKPQLVNSVYAHIRSDPSGTVKEPSARIPPETPNPENAIERRLRLQCEREARASALRISAIAVIEGLAPDAHARLMEMASDRAREDYAGLKLRLAPSVYAQRLSQAKAEYAVQLLIANGRGGSMRESAANLLQANL